VRLDLVGVEDLLQALELDHRLAVRCGHRQSR
jgi:hypothetical protein